MVEVEAIYRFLVENVSDGVYFVDPDRVITGWNRGAELISGFVAPEVVGHRCRANILSHVDDDGTSLCLTDCPLEATMADGRPRQVRVWMRCADGSRLRVSVRATPTCADDGTITGAMEIFTVDAPAGAGASPAEHRPDFFDAVTGIGNERYLSMELAGWVQRWRAHGWRFGVVVLLVDEGVPLRRVYGASTADRALATAGRTLTQVLPQGSVVARFSEDALVGLVACEAAGELAGVAARVEALTAASSVVVDSQPVGLTVTVHQVEVADGDDVESVLGRIAAVVHPADVTR